MGRLRPDENLTLRVDPDVITWARMRALIQGTSLNRIIRAFLERYAAIPEAWWQGAPPPWSPGGRSSAGWSMDDEIPADLLAPRGRRGRRAQAPALEAAAPPDPPPRRQG
jgi:hypothetical protein